MAKNLDSLTGLLKEEWLKQGLEDELNRAERFGRDLGLLLIEPIIPGDLARDLGYPVLKKLGLISKEVTRTVDVGVRIKNRVFYLLPETSVEGVEVATRKIAEKFEEQEFVDSGTGASFKGKIRSAFLVFPSQTKDRDDVLERLGKELNETKATDESKAIDEAEAASESEAAPETA